MFLFGYNGDTATEDVLVPLRLAICARKGGVNV